MGGNLDKSIREVTDEQFAQGTTIDGLRIDRAIEDVAERVGNLQVRDLKGKWKPCTRVLGMAPAWIANPGAWQWLDPAVPPAPPYVAYRYDGATPVDRKRLMLPFLNFDNGAGTENRYRAKGLESLDDQGWMLLAERAPTIVRAFSASLYADRPLVLDALDVALALDGNQPGYPAGKRYYADDFCAQAANWYKGIHVHVSVDSPFDMNDRQHNQVLAHRWDGAADGCKWTLGTGPADAQYAYVSGMPGGLVVALCDLNIPVPARSRVRVVVGLPEYAESYQALSPPIYFFDIDKSSVLSMTLSTLELVTS